MFGEVVYSLEGPDFHREGCVISMNFWRNPIPLEGLDLQAHGSGRPGAARLFFLPKCQSTRLVLSSESCEEGMRLVGLSTNAVYYLHNPFTSFLNARTVDFFTVS